MTVITALLATCGVFFMLGSLALTEPSLMRYPPCYFSPVCLPSPQPYSKPSNGQTINR
jgi:hypothetical protein